MAPADQVEDATQARLLEQLRTAPSRLRQAGVTTDELPEVVRGQVLALDARREETFESEIPLVNLYLLVRVLLVGVILLLFRRITREGAFSGSCFGMARGGAVVETGFAKVSLTGALADDTQWVRGRFYVNEMTRR